MPDQPTDLVNVLDPVTRANQIGLAWTAPVFDGGSNLIDYTIYYDNADGLTFVELVSGVNALEYVATGLTQGATYQFKVEARNVYGLGFFSNTISVLAA